MFRRLWTRWCWFCLPQPGNLGNICYSELFSSSIFMCSDSQRYVTARSLALPFSFFAFCYFFPFSELSFLSLWRLPFSLLSPVCFLKQTQAHPLWWRQCSALKMASQKKNKKTGDNMKTTDKQANRTKVFFCCCYLQDVMLVLERMRSLKIDSFKQWQVRNAN